MLVDDQVQNQLELINYLSIISKMENRKASDQYMGMHQFIRLHGNFMAIDPVQPVYNPHKAKQCYYYSQLNAFEDNFIYCEGLAINESAPLPIFHAWCLNHKHMVIDPTWSTKGLCYFGVKFSNAFIKSVMHGRKGTPYEHHYSMIESCFIENQLLLKANPPNWKAG